MASVILIAIGLASVYMGIDGRDTVRSDLAREQIVGTDDSTIPGQKVDTGSEAKAFAAHGLLRRERGHFVLVVGAALVLVGIGLLVLTIRLLDPRAARPERARGAVPVTG